jgi:hypothetical protein
MKRLKSIEWLQRWWKIYVAANKLPDREKDPRWYHVLKKWAPPLGQRDTDSANSQASYGPAQQQLTP